MTKNQLFLTELTSKIRAMKPRGALYKAIKRELSALGNWKCKPRGNPAKGWATRNSKVDGR